MATIVITGAGSGLGRELAISYSANGHTIFLLGRNEDKLKQTNKIIHTQNGQGFTFPCDITNEQAVKQTVEKITSQFNIDWLINNAGVGYFGEFIEHSSSEINTMIDVNVKGTIYMTKALLPFLQKSTDAKILNIISTAGLRGKVNEAVYCASKFAVRGFTESLQKEYKHTAISITAVYMGGMNTPFWENSTHIQDQSRLKSAKEVAVKIIELDKGQPAIEM